MFEIGDFVVDGTNGVCKIEDTVTPDFATDQEKLYFLLIPVKNQKSKVYIPIVKADERLKMLPSKQEIAELLDEISEIDSIGIDNEKEREKIYKEAVRSCEPRILIAIIKTLYLRIDQRNREGKKVTSVDERYFKIAESTLYSELGFILDLSESDVKSLIQERA